MTDWKDLLRTASIDQALERARGSLGANTTYDLGQGGLDPAQPLTKKCDCSGFVSWAIGIPREFPPRSGRWMDTDAYWNGGGAAARAAGFPLLRTVPSAEAETGDLIVYPDQAGGGQGHIGLISGIAANGHLKVIHCSKGNWKATGDAIRETGPDVFDMQKKTRIMRIDFPAMRHYCGISDGASVPVVLEEERETGVVAASSLHHSLLANDSTLQLVARGALKLTRTGRAVSGIGSVQQGMNVLAQTRPRYAIDLGPNEANSGIFGPNTERALKALQADLRLPETGELDAATLLGLDSLLQERAANVDVDAHSAEVEAASDTETLPPPATPLVFELQREGSQWFAVAMGERFYVGTRVPYEGRLGLMNTRDNSGSVYDPASYVDTHGQWAYFINPTAKAESRGRFKCLNTYDSAGFTFGFLQFAAHVAEGDFVRFFRALLQLDERRAYFPDLALQNGHIVQPTSSGVLQLETPTSSEKLKRYLNPSGGEVEPREVLTSAKFIHWSSHSKAHRDTQVRIGVETVKEKLRNAQRKMELNGRSDKVCFVVMDILHQGRGTYAAMKQIVENNNDAAAYEKLLLIGATRYKDRIATIRAEVARLEAEGHFGTRRYVAASNDFT